MRWYIRASNQTAENDGRIKQTYQWCNSDTLNENNYHTHNNPKVITEY
jgi:hypothetical protein